MVEHSDSENFEIDEKTLNIILKSRRRFVKRFIKYIKLPINISYNSQITPKSIKHYIKFYDLLPHVNISNSKVLDTKITGGYYKKKLRTKTHKYTSTKLTKRKSTNKSNSKSRTKFKRNVSKTKKLN